MHIVTIQIGDESLELVYNGYDEALSVMSEIYEHALDSGFNKEYSIKIAYTEERNDR